MPQNILIHRIFNSLFQETARKANLQLCRSIALRDILRSGTCNKDRQAIEKLENEKVNPTLYTLLEIANALEISLSKLIDLS